MAQRARKYWLTTALDVLGAAAVSFGAWLIYQPAGYIVAGLLILAASYVAASTGTDGTP